MVVETNPSPMSSAEPANRSAHSQAKGMPRGFRLVCRTGRAAAGTDSAMRRFAPQPNATAPSRCHAPCGASRPMAEWRDVATPVGSPPHRSRDPQQRNLAAVVVVHVHLAVAESHRRATMLLVNHAGCHRSTGSRAARPARRRSDGVASSLGPVGGIGTGLRATAHGPDRTTVDNRT